MSNDIQKADQIAYRFYTKLVLVVSNARATAEPSSRAQARVDKWFNIETPDSEQFRDQLRIYRSVSNPPSPPPLELHVLLSVPELTNNQVLVYLAPDSSRVRVEPTPRHIILETWLLSFTPSSSPRYGEDSTDVAPSTIYKHGIPLFRSVFSLLRILPAWNLYKRLRRRTGGSRNGNLSIALRVGGAAGESSEHILGFDTPPASSATPLPNETHVFPSVPHPMGTLSLSAKHLSSPNFQLDELESLLSSRFLSLDVGPEFTPTLAKNQQRDSLISASPGSLPIKTSLPKSPPSSVAERFVLPPISSRTLSLPSSSGSPIGGGRSNVPQGMSRQTSGAAGTGPAGSNSGISVGSSRQDSSSAWSKDDGRPMSGIAARLRKESTGAGRGADLPSAPGPLAIRRPSINPVHPFKSSTLSSGSPSLHSPSPSLRQPSPLSSIGVSALPSRPNQASPASSRVPPSPIGMGSRPSPPFAPSSLGDKRSLASAEGEEPSSSTAAKVPTRKRYSSSFGHRYAASGGAGSEGSAGSGERREVERPGSASFLSTNTDDDDISAFVQDIDSRKPLNGQHRIREREREQEHGAPQPDRDRTVGRTSAERPAGDGESEVPEASSRGTGTGPMLTSESEVDERLRQMNEAFMASLEGLGGSRRKERRSHESSHAASAEVDRERQREESSSGSRRGSERRRMTVGDVPSRGGSSPRPSPSISDAGLGVGMGSEEVVGRMSLDEGSRRSSRQ